MKEGVEFYYPSPVYCTDNAAMIGVAGYYEYKIYTKTKLTQESINQFEEDLKNNKDTSTKDYVIQEYTDYSNKLTKTGSKIGSFIEEMMHAAIKKSLEILSDLFYK